MTTLATQLDGIRTVSGTTERAQLYAAPLLGQKIYRSDTDVFERWNGAAWVTCATGNHRVLYVSANKVLSSPPGNLDAYTVQANTVDRAGRMLRASGHVTFNTAGPSGTLAFTLGGQPLPMVTLSAGCRFSFDLRIVRDAGGDYATILVLKSAGSTTIDLSPSLPTLLTAVPWGTDVVLALAVSGGSNYTLGTFALELLG